MDKHDFSWPEKPKCHDDFFKHNFAWREPRGENDGPYHEEYRSCNYCGSMHPEDLLDAIEAGATITMADWKYGWPHKFYVDFDNPKAGEQCVTGSRDGQPTMGTAPSTITAKWYNIHLEDLDTDEFRVLAELLYVKTGVRFCRDEKGKMFYRYNR